MINFNWNSTKTSKLWDEGKDEKPRKSLRENEISIVPFVISVTKSNVLKSHQF